MREKVEGEMQKKRLRVDGIFNVALLKRVDTTPLARKYRSFEVIYFMRCALLGVTDA